MLRYLLFFVLTVFCRYTIDTTAYSPSPNSTEHWVNLVTQISPPDNDWDLTLTETFQALSYRTRSVSSHLAQEGAVYTMSINTCWGNMHYGMTGILNVHIEVEPVPPPSTIGGFSD